MPDLLLLPQPRRVTITGGYLPVAPARLIVLDGPEPAALRFSALRLQAALQEKAGVRWEIVAGNTVPHEQIGATLSVVESGTRHPQGYELTITPENIHAVASTPAGIFYAVCTLIQLLEPASKREVPSARRRAAAWPRRPVGWPSASEAQVAATPPWLPALRISDWPDFPNRGVMLDVSRDRVPTMQTLLDLVDLLASWKINQLQLYTEHTFAYRNHPEVWAEASPFTGEEILALDAYCRERFIELVPNQNSFGHMTRWLIHDRYRHLAEAPDGCDTRWGHYDVPLSLCPLDPGSIELVRSLYDELLPHFSSRQFNVGCDETIDLGQGRSREAVEKLGAGRVYLDFLLKIYREVKARGRTMQFWGDIIMEHPELVPELPRDVIALEWGYQPDHPFDEHGARFAASGVPFYVCPGTGTWNTIAGRTDSALANLRNAAINGLKHGAIGYLNTDWGDAGHWQPLPVSYLGFAYGAGVSWACDENLDLDMALAISVYAFADPTGVTGRIAYDLGNAYLYVGAEVHNATILARLLQLTYAQFIANRQRFPDLTAEGLLAADDEIVSIETRMSHMASRRPDADLIRREFAWASRMLRHGVHRGLWMLGKADGKENAELRTALANDARRLIAEYRELWHARSRPGGFRDSVARLEKMREDYLA
jgi:hexosaminidase